MEATADSSVSAINDLRFNLVINTFRSVNQQVV